MLTATFDRDSMAAWYAQEHLKTDPGIASIYYLPKNAGEREIRLIEVNQLLADRNGNVLEPIDFGIDTGTETEHKLFVLDVTPQQWERIKAQKLSLAPEIGRWKIPNTGDNERFSKTLVAAGEIGSPCLRARSGPRDGRLPLAALPANGHCENCQGVLFALKARRRPEATPALFNSCGSWDRCGSVTGNTLQTCLPSHNSSISRIGFVRCCRSRTIWNASHPSPANYGPNPEYPWPRASHILHRRGTSSRLGLLKKAQRTRTDAPMIIAIGIFPGLRRPVVA